ncbi:MAG: hypothetical protein JXR96_16275 [Deltaproteobacteria bacterium]|nr:hypothetical protein [Deltaproteobacteria bacterium]
MATKKIHALLDGKWEDGTRPKDVYALYVSKKPQAHVEAVVRGLRADSRRIQNGCAEIASLLSEERPELLYPHLSLFVENLEAGEPVLRWEAACTVGNLAAVDEGRRIPGCLPRLFGFLGDKSIVLQGHAVKALAKCARAYPEEAPGILTELVAAKERFPGNRVGTLIEAMASFVQSARLAKKAAAFVEPYSRSEIQSVAKKASRVLKKIAKS